MRFPLRVVRGVVLLVALALLIPLAHPATAAPLTAGSRYFSQTGQTVQGGFLAFFDRYGGVALFGYPITGEIVEDTRTVQYFQRARFEWHPDNSPAYRVQLGLLGQQIYGPAAPRVQPLAATSSRRVRYFAETGHNVTNVFLDFWTRNGGLDIFGYPLTEAFNKDGVTYQWFQRARFEYRDGRVQLGLLGSEWRSGRPDVVGPPPPSDTIRRRQFPNGLVVQGAFLDYWERNNPTADFGSPLSNEFTENGRTVQYFERARFEWHPNNAPGSRVLLGLLGQELYGPAAPPAANFAPPWNTNYQYFSQTGHTVSNAFLRAFRDKGNVEVFGYPLTEAYEEGGEVVQWFQRRKLVFRAGEVYDVPLGTLRFNPDAEGRFPPQQVFLLFLEANGSVASKLGAGLGDAHNPTIAFQPFEGGAMVWRSDTNQIYVLRNNSTWAPYDNPWRPGDPTSVGYPVPAGRYEPVLGFGEVWRSLGGPSSGLGWATVPQADATGTVQQFQRGTMLYNPVDDKLYVLYSEDGWFSFANQWPDFAP